MPTRASPGRAFSTNIAGMRSNDSALHLITNAHSVTMREDKAGTLARTSQSAWLKRISASVLTLLAKKREPEGRYDPALGDQIKLPQEFLDTVAQSRSPGMRERS